MNAPGQNNRNTRIQSLDRAGHFYGPMVIVRHTGETDDVGTPCDDRVCYLRVQVKLPLKRIYLQKYPPAERLGIKRQRNVHVPAVSGMPTNTQARYSRTRR